MKRLLIATALVAVSGTAWAQDVVRLGTEGAYPPYFINDAGEVAGFEREFRDELCKRAGLTCSWTTNDWDSIIPNLQSGNYDVIVAGMSITPERQEIVDFSQPYLQPTPSASATPPESQAFGTGHRGRPEPFPAESSRPCPGEQAPTGLGGQG